MMENKIKAAVVGAAGYTGGELIRILMNHPGVEITSVQSSSQAGLSVATVHPDMADSNLTFDADFSTAVDVVFLCSGHGKSRAFMEKYKPDGDLRVIDLSQDYRLDDSFIYGLPEANRKTIKGATRIANPGCFATAIQLGLLPAVSYGLTKSAIHTSAITGSTGAGFNPTTTTHFSWRSNNISIYKAFEHQHLAEIRNTLSQINSDFDEAINFLPFRGPFTRGILASSYFEYDRSEEELVNVYREFYKGHPFTFVSDIEPDIKQVVNTNKCYIKVAKIQGKALIVSVIDNLVKGASGQATQNMNLMFGFDESTGLNLKASAF